MTSIQIKIIHLFFNIVIPAIMIAGCGHSTKPYNESRELVPNPEGYKKDTFIVKKDTLVAAMTDSAKIIQWVKSGWKIDSAEEAVLHIQYEVTQLFTAAGRKLALLHYSTGTCSQLFLLAYNDHGIQKCAEVDQECDTELSYYEYHYKTGTQRADTLFDIQNITETVKDKRLIDKTTHFLKGGRSRDDVACKEDTTRMTIGPSFLFSSKVPAWPD